MGLIAGIFAGVWQPARCKMYPVLVEHSGSLLGTTVSLMGFVIAALAIVLATPTRSVRLIRSESAQLWKQLTGLFTQASSTFGIFSLFLLVAIAAAPTQPQLWVEVLWVVPFVGLTVTCILQIVKVIGLLDLVIAQHSSPGDEK